MTTWIATKMSENPLGGHLGAEGGISGTMMLAGQEVLVHCGGWDDFNDKLTDNCFVLRVDSNGEVMVEGLMELPGLRRFTCNGSDAGRLATAGGEDLA